MTNDNSKYINIALAFLGISTIIWIFYIKNTDSESSIVLPVIIGIVIAIVFIISSFGKSISQKLKNISNTKEKVLNESEVMKKVYDIITDYKRKDAIFRNIERVEERRSRDVEGDEIYAVLVRLSYPVPFNGKDIDGLWIIVNASSPSMMPSVIRGDTENLDEEINFKSRKYRDPVVVERITENESLGFKSSEKTTKPSPEPKEEEESAIWV